MLGICFAHFEEICFLLMNGGAEENILLVVPKPAWGGNRLVGTELLLVYATGYCIARRFSHNLIGRLSHRFL